MKFKPGDLAMVTWEKSCTGGTAPAFLTENGLWNFADGKQIHSSRTDDLIKAARPLVVLDPENAEDVQRLADLFMRESVYPTTDALNVAVSIKAALRELASPTPPKPDEPTGLGAVMEDKAGCLWVRSGASHVSPNWRRCGEDEWHDYDDIDAVRVLSEGVPE